MVVQWSGDRSGVARRLRLGLQLAQVAPWLPIPTVLGGDVRTPIPFVITSYVAGQSGGALLADDKQAEILGTLMGSLARDVQRVPTKGLRLSSRWGDGPRLEAAAGRWLTRAAGALGSAGHVEIARRLHHLRTAAAEAPPVFAHGDLAPVNVIVRDSTLVALLDLERARLAHPLFDAAWFRLMVRHHHPERWGAVGPTFMKAARIPQRREVTSTLDILAIAQCLEHSYLTPSSDSAARAAWAKLALAVLDWDVPGEAGRCEN
jgi:aminoglycoside phosphotransferase (APT) family kinase protein